MVFSKNKHLGYIIFYYKFKKENKMTSLNEKLKAINLTSQLMGNNRRLSLINFLTHKTDKIQLVFENISNPQNVVI